MNCIRLAIYLRDVLLHKSKLENRGLHKNTLGDVVGRQILGGNNLFSEKIVTR